MSSTEYTFVELVGPNDDATGTLTPLIDFEHKTLVTDDADGRDQMPIAVKSITIFRYTNDRKDWIKEGTVIIKHADIIATDSRVALILRSAKDEGQSMFDTISNKVLQHQEKWILAGHCWHSWPRTVTYRGSGFLEPATVALMVQDANASFVQMKMALRREGPTPAQIAATLAKRICEYRLTNHDLSDEQRGDLERIAANPEASFKPTSKSLKVSLPGALTVGRETAAVHRRTSP